MLLLGGHAGVVPARRRVRLAPERRRSALRHLRDGRREPGNDSRSVRPAALKIVGFIDDDPMHRHVRVGGYSVVGSFSDLQSLIRAGDLDLVVLNTPLLDADRLRELERCGQEHDVQVLRLQMQSADFRRVVADACNVLARLAAS